MDVPIFVKMALQGGFYYPKLGVLRGVLFMDCSPWTWIILVANAGCLLFILFSFCKFRKFATDLQGSLVPLTSTSLCELLVLVDGYNQAVASALGQHAPLKTKKVVYEHYQPWYCSMIGDAIRNHRKLEGIWRADVNSKDKWVAFDKQRKLTPDIIKKKEKEYYHQLFIEKATNPKEVFSIANALLARNNISPLPECSSHGTGK